MKLLLVMPGGLDQDAGKFIPVLPPILYQLARIHDLRVVLTRQDSHYREFTVDGIPVISLPATRGRYALRQFSAILSYCKQNGFRPEVVHAFWLGMPTLLGALVARCFRAPLFSTLWGGELVRYPDIDYGGLRGNRRRLIHSLSARFPRACSVGSNYLMSRIPPALAQKTRVIPLGIDPGFWPIKWPPDNSACCNILHIGSHSPIKNPDLLVLLARQLAARHLSFQITSVGLDLMNGATRRLAATYGVGGFLCFQGEMDASAVRDAMRDQHFVVQTSLYESQGVALMEAVSQGLCPVGTRVGWMADIGLGTDPGIDSLAADIADDICSLWASEAQRKRRVEDIQASRWMRSASDTAAAFCDSYRALVSPGASN